MSPATAALLPLLLLTLAWSAYRLGRLARPLLAASPEHRLDRPGTRARGVVVHVLGHARLLRRPYSGLLHLLIFSGFLVLLTAVVEGFGVLLAPGFNLGRAGETGIALVQDVFGVLVLIGVAMAAYQRIAIRPERFRGSSGRDAAAVLALILAVVASMLLESSLLAVGDDPPAGWQPVSSALGDLFGVLGVGGEAGRSAAEVFRWTHALAVLGFLAYIPASKHLHILAGIPNVFLRDLKPPGRLSTPDLERMPLGLADVRGLGRKQMLDLYACTECGRCQDACPAYAAGQPLSPKLLITDLRDNLLGRGRPGPLAGVVISEETIWACTTCGACMEACPLLIEHVPKIVDLRRHLTMELGRLPEGVAGAVQSLERRGHPWAGSGFSRTDWCRDLGVRVLGPGDEAELLLWVGCTAAFDARAQRVARSLVRLLQAAEVNFGILGDAETCTGDAARRAGYDYLFQLQAQANVETLAERRFQRIVTICPHCLNTLRNEYGAFGGQYEVVHHSQLLTELVAAGRLPQPAVAGLVETATFHDPCYLGRYNGEFAAPRALLEASGRSVVEMERSGSASFCCGAGGGRAFAVDPPGQRVNAIRAEQARATGCGVVATACPFCLLMLEDGAGVAARAEDEPSTRQRVCDVAELLESTLLGPASGGALTPAEGVCYTPAAPISSVHQINRT